MDFSPGVQVPGEYSAEEIVGLKQSLESGVKFTFFKLIPANCYRSSGNKFIWNTDEF